MSCLKCIKRIFGIKEEQNDISLSLYIKNQKDHIYDDDPQKIEINQNILKDSTIS